MLRMRAESISGRAIKIISTFGQAERSASYSYLLTLEDNIHLM